MAAPKNLIATTLNDYRKELADNVTTHIPFFKLMKEKNNIKSQGGKAIQIPIEYSDNTSTMSFEGNDPLTITDDDIITALEVRWGRYNTSITYNSDEEAFNDGPARIVDFIEAKIKNAERSTIKKLSKHAMLDGSQNAKDIYGIGYYVKTAPAAGGLVAGIDPTDVDSDGIAYWQNVVVDNATHGAWGSSTNKYGRASIEDLFVELTRNEEFPDIAMTSRKFYKKLKAEYDLAEINQLGTTNGAAKKAYGSRGFSVDGVDIIHDNNLNSTNGNEDVFYGLNSDYFKLIIHSKKNFVMVPFMNFTNQAACVGHIRVYLNLVCTNRKQQGVIKTLT